MNRNRDYLFDNYKVLLIILVVIGHFLEPFRDKSQIMNSIVITIYSFHMPAFIFISAYFSRKNNAIKLVKRILIPYLVFQIIDYLLWNYVFEIKSDFQLLNPQFSLWFLLSLFCWRLMIDKVIRIKGILIISIVLGILVGFDSSIGSFGAIGRTIGFLPFFILGFTFNKDKFVYYIHNKFVRFGLMIVLGILLVACFQKSGDVIYDVLTLKYSYKKLDILKLGWHYRLFLYIWAVGIIYLLAAVVPRRRHWFSYVGQRTLSIYLLHGIVYKVLEHKTNFFDQMETENEMILSIIFAIALAFLLSLKPFSYCINKISDIPIEKLLVLQSEQIKRGLKQDGLDKRSITR